MKADTTLEILLAVARGVLPPEQESTLEGRKDKTRYILSFQDRSWTRSLRIPRAAIPKMQVEDVQRRIRAWATETPPWEDA